MEPKTQLETIYELHASSLFAFLLQWLRSEDQTKEVLQELFHKLAARPEILNGRRRQRIAKGIWMPYS